MKAFTLLETVIIIAISSIVLLAIGLLIFMFTKGSSYEQAALQSSNAASAVIREAQALITPAHAVVASRVFSGTTYTTSATVLILEIPSYDSSGNSIANTYDYAVFYTSGTNLYRILEANAASRRVSGTKKLSSTLQSLTFTYNNGDYSQATAVTIDIQTQAQVKQDVASDHRHEQITLRNR